MWQRGGSFFDEYGMVQSMSRKGDCWDNAPTESFFNTLKTERVYRTRYLTRAEAGRDLFEYIECFLQPEAIALIARVSHAGCFSRGMDAAAGHQEAA